MASPRQTAASLIVTVALAVTFLYLGLTFLRAGSAEPTRHVVHLRGMLFQPSRLQVAPGDTVEWVNDDTFMHAVKASDQEPSWQSKDLPPHASWTMKFTESVKYLCPYHPTMTGEIVVSRETTSSRH